MAQLMKTGLLALIAGSSLLATAVIAEPEKDMVPPAPPAPAAQDCPHMPAMRDGMGMGHHGPMCGGKMGPMMKHGIMGNRGGMMPMMMHGLDLTDAQRADVHKLLKAQHESMQAQRKAHMDAMQALLTAKTFDEAKAKQLLAQKQQQREQHQLARLKMQQQIYNLLTDEQKAKLKARFEKHFDYMDAPDAPQPE
ncbi:Spy/CpxP family protein refolding chaperone [Shewanella mangrovi]|uniref:Spy/CpxP family protein refolding chaperone n=1 Tax=Shewanella mangrovi TaxID=1515746 RepID=UPI00068F16C8|nr:Spy/CpxP family protein refolding chaperone [Shewanella mangrovi]